MAKPVRFPTRAVKPRDEAAGEGVAYVHKDDRRPRLLLNGDVRRGPGCQDDVGLQADQFLCEHSYPIGAIAVPPKVNPHIAAIGPTQVRKRLRERGDARLIHGIVFVARHEDADAPDAVALLRPRHHRSRRRTPERCDERPAPH
jgi:hypothetical protein